MIKTYLLTAIIIWLTAPGLGFSNNGGLPWKKGICKNEIQAKQADFKPEKFFTGRWYDGQSFGTFFRDVIRKCIKVDVTYSDLVVKAKASEYIPVIFSTVSQEFEFTLDKSNLTSFEVTLAFLGMTYMNFPVDVLSTDYTNYALLYSCTPALGLDGYIAEMAFVLRRRRGDPSLGTEIRNLIWQNGIVYEDFAGVDNSDCPDD